MPCCVSLTALLILVSAHHVQVQTALGQPFLVADRAFQISAAFAGTLGSFRSLETKQDALFAICQAVHDALLLLGRYLAHDNQKAIPFSRS